jgi:predicted GNAT superfamily acetyltransferase
MTTTEPTGNIRLPKPIYAVAGAGEIAYRRLRTLPERVEALRERVAPRVRTLRAELPGRVETLRAEIPARVTMLVSEAREVYGGLVARGEQVVDAARARRRTGSTTGASANGVRAVAKKAVKKAAPAKS